MGGAPKSRRHRTRSPLLYGNDDALAVVVDRYQRLVFSVALRIVKDEGEAEDVVQIVFLDVFRNAGKFYPEHGTRTLSVNEQAMKSVSFHAVPVSRNS